MTPVYEGAIQDLIDEFDELPGVGPKSAQRMAFHILAADAEQFVEALRAVKARVRFCETCGNISESEQCAVCRDPRRDQRVICVVEEPKDLKHKRKSAKICYPYYRSKQNQLAYQGYG